VPLNEKDEYPETEKEQNSGAQRLPSLIIGNSLLDIGYSSFLPFSQLS